MMLRNILVIEASTESGSVALARNGALVAKLSFSSRDPVTGARTEALAPAVAQCLTRASISPRDLAAVVCDAGPGGFTSLRSAAAFAKGLCSALQIPLYAVSSLELLVWSASLTDGDFVAALHAGRNEWFTADVSRGNDATVVGATLLVSDDELHARAARNHARLIGPGLDYSVTPCADAVIPRLEEVKDRGAVDLDSWEPEYGRLAEAQVKWEAAHGRSLSV